jgi:uncharacterized protein (TIGR03083 family)
MTVVAGTISGMETTEYIYALKQQALTLGNAAASGGLDAAVPTCPPWRVRDLVRHQGYVHRWATGYVLHQHQDAVPELTEAEQLTAGPDDSGLLDWFEAGYADLVAALKAADPAMSCLTFLPATSALAFWARRQAHETAIHCFDARLAAGLGHSYPADFAADGIDELVIGFFGRHRDRMDSATLAAGPGPSLQVYAADVGLGWHVQLTPDRLLAYRVGRGGMPGPAPADCTLTGPAAELYLLLWNRRRPDKTEVVVSGDASVLHAWQQSMHVRW